MRLLTTDEELAVSGGSHLHPDIPYALNGSGDNDWCGKITRTSARDRCYARRQAAQDCPGGFTESTEGGSAGSDGIKGRTTTFECKPDNSDNGCSDGSAGGDGGSTDGGND